MTSKTTTTRKGMPGDLRNAHPGAGEQAGEGIGGIGGSVVGASIGSLAGPVGALLGGIAGAVGGWWAGEKAGRAVEDIEESDQHYRSHWEKNNSPSMTWDEASVGYGIGHIAGKNPGYAGLSYDQIEEDIQSGWNWKDRDYTVMRPYVRTGYERTSGGKGDKK